MPENIQTLLAAAEKPNAEAMRLHPFYKGKIQVTLKCPVRDINDFSIWYTPGVAAPCKAIAKDTETVNQYTNKSNFVAVVSDGTRVLGLGDIGPEAAMPVMEGKALLFKFLGGVDAFPICLKTKDPEEIIRTCRLLEGTFGGINLEDIEQPKCFHILDILREQAEIPVWHDDQQGTATVIIAGLFNALKLVGKKIEDVKVCLVGAGAAGIATARLMLAVGFTPGNIIITDIHGTLHKDREDFKNESDKYKQQWHMCRVTNKNQVKGGIPEAMKGADILVSFAAPGPGIIKKEWIQSMNTDSIVFVCANPVPEIWPWEAKEAGARIVATGRSDFPNQVNNSLGFPGIFRGTLDVRAQTITDEMCIAAAKELAKCAEEKNLAEDHILPDMTDIDVPPRIAAAVGMKAIEQGIAGITATREELIENATRIIANARESVLCLMEHGHIKNCPEC